MKIIISIFVMLFFINCSSNNDEVKLNTKVQTDSNFTESNTTDENSNTNPTDSDIDENITRNQDDKDDEVKNNVETDIIEGDGNFNIDENMQIGKIYQMEKGDTLFEIDDAKVRIIKNSENSFSEIILLSGKAKIIRNSNWF